jgi:hypothetical protein
VPRVLREIALKSLKNTVISAHCHGIITEKAVEKIFARFPGLKGG